MTDWNSLWDDIDIYRRRYIAETYINRDADWLPEDPAYFASIYLDEQSIFTLFNDGSVE